MSQDSGPSESQAAHTRFSFKLLWRFFPTVKPHLSLVLGGLAAIPVITAAGIWRPLLIKRSIDVSIPQQDLPGLMQVALLFLGAVVLEYLATGTQLYCLQRAGHTSIRDLRRQVFSHILRLPASYFDKHPVGVLVSRTTSDIEALSETLSFGVFTIISDVVLILGTLVTMFMLSPRLTLMSLAVAPVLFLLIRIFSRLLRRWHLEIRKSQGTQIGYLTEQLTGVGVLQLFGREGAAKARFSELSDRYRRATKRANIFDAMLYSIMDGLTALCVALLVFFAAPMVLDVSQHGQSAVSLGLLFAFVDYLQRIFVPIREFSGKVATVQRAVAALDRVFHVLDEPAETRSGVQDPRLARWTGALRVKDLRFAYGEQGPDILKGVSFSVERAEIVAVVGRTGSGKTSLGRVLAQIYAGYRGSVQMEIAQEGAASEWVELRDFEPAMLRRQLLLVQQDVFLFDDSVAFNVALGDESLSGDPQAIAQALEVVQATSMVQSRGGHDFRVGERGKQLSAGEIQLLAFARVAARAPRMLILDEATSNVDSATEHKVQAAIERVFEGRAVLVIAHRLSTVRNADKILVFDAGQIVESGTHDVLMQAAGIYADLYKSGLQEASTTTA